MTLTVLISASPERAASVAHLGDGLECKLDWQHAERLSADHTLADEYTQRGVDPAAVTSVHLPPGTTHPQGMSVAPGAVGTITDFTNRAFGAEVAPDWLTVHTTREFDYREQVDRLETITEVGGYPLAVENLPDPSHYHTPEDVAAVALLADRVPRLDAVSVLVDTAHVPMDRREPTVDDDALETVLARLDGALRERLADALGSFLRTNHDRVQDRIGPGVEPPAPDSPWRPVFVMLALAGGTVGALHLNDPATDGLPGDSHGSDGLPGGDHGSDGLAWVLAFCREHDVPVVLEPGDAPPDAIASTVERLRADD